MVIHWTTSYVTVWCGLMNSKIQQKLRAEKPATLSRDVEIAQGMETASKNAKELAQQEGPSTTTNAKSVRQVTPRTQAKDW